MCVLVKRNLYNCTSKGVTINVIFYEWQKRRGKLKYKHNTPTQGHIYIYGKGSKNYGVYY
jgi:hypothetical protein